MSGMVAECMIQQTLGGTSEHNFTNSHNFLFGVFWMANNCIILFCLLNCLPAHGSV